MSDLPSRPSGDEWVSCSDPRCITYILLMAVPPGYVVTYGLLAKLVGTSPRAIGAYMRSNRNPIVVPCHRVVGSKGPGGYSLGLDFKLKLLQLEGAAVNGKLVDERKISSPDVFWEVLEREGGQQIVMDPDE
ncbi:MAG: MGMT family protein [Thermoproteota archaeon]